ncbi:MAG: hypothetical protein K0B37_17265 [Bacteroidales bacterium]|nr:hypothetical protein [Bacteroidales bacterium]
MRKTQRHTQAEMFAHVEACMKKNHPQKIYCTQQGVAYSTFQYWAKKYREEFSEKDDQDFTPGFIPIKVESDPETSQVRIPGQLHFLFPNGIQVMCPESVHPEVLKTLLNP